MWHALTQGRACRAATIELTDGPLPEPWQEPSDIVHSNGCRPAATLTRTTPIRFAAGRATQRKVAWRPNGNSPPRLLLQFHVQRQVAVVNLKHQQIQTRQIMPAAGDGPLF